MSMISQLYKSASIQQDFSLVLLCRVTQLIIDMQNQ